MLKALEQSDIDLATTLMTEEFPAQLASIGLSSMEEMLDSWRANRQCTIHDWELAFYHEDKLGFLSLLYSDDGVRYQTMLIPTVHLKNSAATAIRTIRRFHENLEARTARRFTTAGICTPALAKWHRAIGYTQEGVHPLAGADGSDFVSWGRTSHG